MLRIPHDQLAWRTDDLYYHQGQPFSGIGYGLAPDGWLLYEIEYREGIQCGTAREWGGPEQLVAERSYGWAWLHGPTRVWHDNGKLAEESGYEMGFCLVRKKWDDRGQLIEDYALQPTDAEYRLLEQKRKERSPDMTR